MNMTTRRDLVRRLALTAAGGAVAPVAGRITPAMAHHRADHAGGPGSGGNCPFGVGAAQPGVQGQGKGPPF